MVLKQIHSLQILLQYYFCNRDSFYPFKAVCLRAKYLSSSSLGVFGPGVLFTLADLGKMLLFCGSLAGVRLLLRPAAIGWRRGTGTSYTTLSRGTIFTLMLLALTVFRLLGTPGVFSYTLLA